MERGIAMRRVVYAGIAVVIVVCNILPHAYAGRPLSTDDAGTIEPGHLQVELAAEHLRESSKDKETSVSAVFTTGVIWDRLDFAVGVPYLWLDPSEDDNCNGFGDLQSRFKLRFIDESDLIPALAVTAGVKAKTGDCEKGLGTGTTDFIGNFIATKCINKLTLHGNVGYNATGDLEEEEIYDFINLGLAGEYAFTDKFTIVGEVYAEVATEDTDDENPVDILIGAKYTLPIETVLDGGVAFGLTDGAPDYRITVGLTHVF